MGHSLVDPVKVLLVEDDPLDAELVADELNGDHSVQIERVDDEHAFVESLMRFHPDIVISDLSMPTFSGHRALELSRKLAPKTPFVFVSGTIGEEAAIQALRSGATDYVLKQNLARLRTAVARALAEAAERVARERAEEDLIRAHRYESLALLASGLSHDLRNVLQPIAMGASMLQDDGRDEVRRVGEMIADCTQRGLDIVASMLSYARGSRAEMGRVDARALLDGLALLLRGTVPSNIRLEVAPPPEGVEVEGHLTELQQALLNLALNAAQSMPEGGALRIAADKVSLTTADFGSGEPNVPGRYLRFSVADTGIGMSADTLARLFQPFFTTKKTGTGLGLVSCQRIAENHRGFLRVESVLGQGTTFSLFVPLPDGGLGAGDAVSLADLPRGHGERVLVVIEASAKLSLLTATLDEQGYTSVPAQNGAVALRVLGDDMPSAVIMEGEMNFLTGVRVAEALIEAEFAGPVLLISRAGADRTLDAPPFRRVRFIDKPVDPIQLLRVLAEELQRQPR